MLGCREDTCPKFLRKAALKAEISVPIIWILGGPGSGKGTQCEKIVATYCFVHLSTGELLRDEVERGSPRGQEMKMMMDKGELVPDAIVLEMLYEAMLSNLQNAKGFLIDGYPRKKEQGVMFEEKIAPVTCILFFEVQDDTMIERLLKRAQSSGRSDDNEETIKRRLQTFHKEKNLILKQYTAKLKNINAERSVDEIFADVQTVLDPLIL